MDSGDAFEDAGLEGPKRQRTSTACEACRVSKIRCRPSSQPGVCEKCLQSKRECVSRTCPRTRRAKKLRPEDKTKPPGPTGTFTIDLEYAAQQESDETFASLLDTHTAMLDTLLPVDLPWAPVGHHVSSSASSAFPSTPTSAGSGGTSTTLDTNAKPKFNLASAQALLSAFRRMLPHFPCISLGADADVPGLAQSKPFALLAILASASGSRTLHGHSLYDEEFRKVLALKFVASGERSLALLQGILIYCAWYPFHLRPKNNQVRQYIRMASDLVRDLGLDQPPPPPLSDYEGCSAERMEGVRAYVCYHYLLTALTVSWRSYRGIYEPFTPWTSKCCDMLTESGSYDDQLMAALTHIGNTVNSAAEAMRQDTGQTDQQRGLLLMGIEAQLDSICQAMPENMSQEHTVKIAAQYARVYIIAAPLLRPGGMTTPDVPSTPKLRLCTHLLRQLLLYFASSPAADEDNYDCFSAPEWTRYVLCVVLAVRLAFAVVGSDWDARWARHTLRLSEVLGHVVGGGSSSPHPTNPAAVAAAPGKVNVLSAFKVIVGVIRDRYDQRVAALERQEREMEEGAQAANSSKFGCPLLDGSLSEYMPTWDGAGLGEAVSSSNDPLRSLGGEDGGADGPVIHDLWATMTMNWTSNPDEFSF